MGLITVSTVVDAQRRAGPIVDASTMKRLPRLQRGERRRIAHLGWLGRLNLS